MSNGISIHGRSQDFFGGGDTFSKIFKKYSKNIQILKNFQKYSKKFRKLLKILLRKSLKIHYFSRFFTKFNKLCVNFLRVWMKKTIYWKL